jgi:hypothetical protein
MTYAAPVQGFAIQPVESLSRSNSCLGIVHRSEVTTERYPASLWPIGVPIFLPPLCLSFGVHYRSSSPVLTLIRKPDPANQLDIARILADRIKVGVYADL